MSVPAVRLEVRLEGVPRLHVVADTFEEELRLRAWLRSSGVLEQVREALDRLPDELDAIDDAEWATGVVNHLEHVRSRGASDWLAVCPICRQYTLAVHARTEGRTLVTCFNGCDFDVIRRAIERAAA